MNRRNFLKFILVGLLILGAASWSVLKSSEARMFLSIVGGGVASGDIIAPTLSTATIGTNGTTWTFVFDETVVIGAGGNGGWAVSMSTQGAITLAYSSGSGSNTLVYTGNKMVLQGETVSAGLDYTQPGNGIEDASGNDLANIDDKGVTNNSTQTPSYLFEENFEGTGYENSWIEDVYAGGMVNEDYATSPAPLRGSQSLYIADVGWWPNSTYTSFAGGSPRYAHLMVRKTIAGGDNWDDLIVFQDSAGNNLFRLKFYIEGTARIWHGTEMNSDPFTFAVGTTYHVWLEYTKGTGANGNGKVYVGTTNIKPALTAEITIGTSTADAARIYLSESCEGACIFDQVIVDSSVIGDVAS